MVAHGEIAAHRPHVRVFEVAHQMPHGAAFQRGVGVHQHHKFAARHRQPHVNRCRLALTPRHAMHAQAVVRGEPAHLLAGAIGRAVVDEDDFDVGIGLFA